MPLPDSGTIAIYGAAARLKHAALIRLPEHVLKQITSSALDGQNRLKVSLEDGVAFLKANGDKIHLSSSAESNPTHIYELDTKEDALKPVATAKARLYTLTANAKRIADLAKKDIAAKAGFNATRGNFAKPIQLASQPKMTILERCGGKPTKPSTTGVAMARTQSSPAMTGDKSTKTEAAKDQVNQIPTLRDRGIAGKPAVIMQLALGPMRELDLVSKTGYPADMVRRVAGTQGIGARNKFDPRKYELDPKQYDRVKTTDYDKYTHLEKGKFLALARKAYDAMGLYEYSEERVELDRREKEYRLSRSTSSTGTASMPASTESKYSDLPRVKDKDEKRGDTKSTLTDGPSEPSSTKSKVSALPRIPRIAPGQQQPASTANIPPAPVRPPTEEETIAREAAERFARNFVPAKKKGFGKWAGQSGTDMKRGASMPNTKGQNGLASPRFPDKSPLPVHKGIKADKSPLSIDEDNKAIKSPLPPVDNDADFIYYDKQGKAYKTPRPVHFASKKQFELWHRDNIDYSTDDESDVQMSRQENDVSAASDKQGINDANKDGPLTHGDPAFRVAPASTAFAAGSTATAMTAVNSGPTAQTTNAVPAKKRLSPKEEQIAALPPRPAQGCPMLPLPKKEGTITPPLLPVLKWEPGATPPVRPLPPFDHAPVQSRQSSGSGPEPSRPPIPDGGNKRKTPPTSLDFQANQKPRITPPSSTKLFTELRERWEELTPAYERLAQKLKEISLAASNPSSGPRIEVSLEEVKTLTARWQGWHNELAAISARFGENTP